MIIVAGHILVDPSVMDRMGADMKALEAVTRTEDGCEYYAMAIDDAAVGHITVLEQWRDEAALKAHLATPGVRTFLENWGGSVRTMGVKLHEISAVREVEP